ncbi:MAG: hypothetical protein D6734_10805 [Candidatus Schekmanbacteria bacterium]|nr:MAG: hypothetical protein D6734_10805 [Candidatus Schekmanbacteria bacterium]
MSEISRRDFEKTLLKGAGALSILTFLNSPRAVFASMKFSLEDEKFLKRSDEELGYALKSLFMTYDSTSPYPHKFNETITKAQLQALDFYWKKGLGKEYVEHYITTMKPLLARIGKMAKKKGAEFGLMGMFEGTTCSYQLYERINIKKGERSFPCPFRDKLYDCKQWLGAVTGDFDFELLDVCNKWCIPVWEGFAKEIGIKIKAFPGETCKVKLLS